MNPEVLQTLNFLREIDNFKQIERWIRMPITRDRKPVIEGQTWEDDAQHSWHMAMMVWMLAPYQEKPIDLLKAFKMSLCHDLCELDHGDVSAFDPVGRIGKQEREIATMDRLATLLPQTLAEELREIWEEYETGESPEAKFVQQIDKLQPMIQNIISGGRDWQEDNITEAMIRTKKDHLYPPSTNLTAIYNDVIAEGKRSYGLEES